MIIPEPRPDWRSQPPVRVGRPGLLAMLGQALAASWVAHPVPAPVLPPNLSCEPFLTRAVEVLRYQLLSLEYSLAGGGGLRAWLRLNLLLALFLLTPTVLLVPVVTALLSGLAAWTALLVIIISNLVMAVVWGLLLAGLLATILVAMAYLRHRLRSRS